MVSSKGDLPVHGIWIGFCFWFLVLPLCHSTHRPFSAWETRLIPLHAIRTGTFSLTLFTINTYAYHRERGYLEESLRKSRLLSFAREANAGSMLRVLNSSPAASIPLVGARL